MEELTRLVAEFVQGTSYDYMPRQTVEKIKTCVLDTIGCAVAGNDAPETRVLIDGLIEPQEVDNGPACIWMDGTAASVKDALLVNSAMSHAVELDDLHKASKTHPGAVMVSGVLTAGAPLHISGKEALAAIITGYEVMIRLGEAVGTVSHRKQGWHATATCGTFGAAAAFGKLLGLDVWEIRNALGLAGAQAAGSFAFLNDGSLCKRFQVGKATLNGWLAATLAKAGLTGSTVIFEAEESGYLKAVSDEYFPEKLLDGLGETYLTDEIGLKCYACCGHTHQGIYAAISLRNQYGIRPEDIDRVKVRTYKVSNLKWGISGEPENSVEAQFNFPFVVALALTDGQVSLAQFEAQKLCDPGINALAQKVTVVIDEGFSARYPAQWCSGVDIYLKDGRVVSQDVIGAKGDPQNPMTMEEVEDKFRMLTEGKLSAQRQKEICELVRNMDQLEDIEQLTRLLSRPA